MREADLYKKLNSEVRCLACARRCTIPNGLYGFCGVRKNENGKLIVANYGIFIAVNLDPIEKKPLYHFYPGHKALSLGTTGCSWACKFCINYDISQRRKIMGYELSPEEVLQIAKEYDAKIVTFTYNEPSIYAEFSYDFAKIAKKEGIKITWVTNGWLTDEAIDYAKKFLDAVTIDLKASENKEALRKLSLVPDPEPVFQTIEEFYKAGIHVEITDLIIPEYTPKEDTRRVAKFLYDVMGEDAIVHVLRFHPEYKMSDHYPTPISELEEHAKIFKEEGVKYVYIGNVPGHPLENTYCPKCGRPVIKRHGFLVYEVNLTEDGRCKFCGAKINIKGEAKTSEIAFPQPVPINKPFVVKE